MLLSPRWAMRLGSLLSLLLVVEPALGATIPPDSVKARFDAGDYEAAIRFGQARLAQSLPADETIRTLGYLGASCYELARYGEAVGHLRHALDLLAAGQGADRASLLNDLGECLRADGQFETARRTLADALSTVQAAAPESELHARILNNVAGLSRDTNDFARAEQLLDQSLRITEKLPDASAERRATAHLNLGELLRFQSRLTEAEPHYLAALRIARGEYPPAHPDLVYFLNQLADLRSEQSRFAAADSLRREALHVLDAQRSAYPALRALVLAARGTDAMTQNDPAAASDLFREAMRLRMQLYRGDHWEVGTVLAQLARAEQAAGVSARTVVARASDALRILSRSSVAPESRIDALAVRALAGRSLGRTADAASDLDQALDLLEDLRVTRGGGDESRALLLARHGTYYDEAVHNALSAGRVERALGYAERFRARVLKEELALDHEGLLASLPADEREALEAEERAAAVRLTTVQDQITRLAYLPKSRRTGLEAHELQGELDVAVRAYAATQERLRSHSPAWSALLADRETTSLARLQAGLARGEILLFYWIGPVHAWLVEVPSRGAPPRAFTLSIAPAAAGTLGVTPGTLTTERLAAALSRGGSAMSVREIYGLSRGVSDTADLPEGGPEAARTPLPDAAGRRLHALWESLVPGPCWDDLVGAAAAIIVPSGPLHSLPFESLVVDPSPGQARDWLDRGPPVRYVDSAGTLQQLERRSRRAPSYDAVDVLSVCDPVTGGSSPRGDDRTTMGAAWPDLPRLPGTEEESMRVRAALGTRRVQTLCGPDATESATRLGLIGKRYLHLATHGVVDESENQILAGLVLTREGPEPVSDGRLQLYEISGLPLTAQLAVLSACRTAAGRSIDGEGVFALARGFHVAGVDRVVASLWPVSDASTVELVGAFFARIAEAEAQERAVDYATALRDAKRVVKSDPRWGNPRYWAPFVLSGAR